MDNKKQVMIKTDGAWTLWKFKFDSTGNGLSWHCARGTGEVNSVENSTRHFLKLGYTIVDWKEF